MQTEEADVPQTQLPLPPALIVQDGVPYADSRQVAEFFKKDHRNVLQKIDSIISDEPGALLNFQQGSYTLPSTGSQEHRCYLMNRDGFALVGMRFTGKRAIKFQLAYIAAFNAMEAELRRRIDEERADPFLPGAAVTASLTEDVLKANLHVLVKHMRGFIRDQLAISENEIEKRVRDGVRKELSFTEVRTIAGSIGGVKKALKNPDTWTEAGVMLKALPTPDTEFVTARQVCTMVLGVEPVASLPAIVGRKLTEHALDNGLRQSREKKRSPSDDPPHAYVLSDVLLWLEQGNAEFIRAENLRRGGQSNAVPMQLQLA